MKRSLRPRVAMLLRLRLIVGVGAPVLLVIIAVAFALRGLNILAESNRHEAALVDRSNTVTQRVLNAAMRSQAAGLLAIQTGRATDRRRFERQTDVADHARRE